MLWSEVTWQRICLPVAQGQATSLVLVRQGPPKERGTRIAALPCDQLPPAPGPLGSPQCLAGDGPGPAFSTMGLARKSASSYIF